MLNSKTLVYLVDLKACDLLINWCKLILNSYPGGHFWQGGFGGGPGNKTPSRPGGPKIVQFTLLPKHFSFLELDVILGG